MHRTPCINCVFGLAEGCRYLGNWKKLSDVAVLVCMGSLSGMLTEHLEGPVKRKNVGGV